MAQVRAKVDADIFAEQIHWTGAWYNKALIAVENQGGYGNSLIIGLRDGRHGRPPYPALYRHRQFLRGDQQEHQGYGFPMSSATRPQILDHLEELVRTRSIPGLTHALADEMASFVMFDPNKPNSKGPWPRAQDGANDDCVMAAAIAVEMYRQHGHHPKRHKPKPRPRPTIVRPRSRA